MHPLIEELIEKARITAQLNHHHLYLWELYREKDALYQTRYLLSMEWFPVGKKKRMKDGSNPPGTVSITMDMHSKRLKSIIFVHGKGSNIKVNHVEEWISSVTGILPSQYKCTRQNEGDYELQACVRKIPVHPGGYINIQTDDHGNLTMFSQSGYFPNDDEAAAEEFRLTVEDVWDSYYSQLKFHEVPSKKENRYISLFSIEEVFVVNDDQSLITYEITGHEEMTVVVDQGLNWEEVEKGKKAKLKPLDWNHEKVTMLDVLENQPHPDLIPLTEREIENAKRAVLSFMQNQYPKESGIWYLLHLKRDGGYMNALLKMAGDKSVFAKWKRLFLDSEGHHVINAMDNDWLIDAVKELEPVGQPALNKDEAFSRLTPYLQIQPFYVYHNSQKRFVLSGKLDCAYAVDAVTGELLELNKI
ncbi:hypothetical protein ACFQPF_16285 [Fictibacillus iocasae]|uniref:DUF4901 domain-containing protein n=1 Tax=Fictibacillus iocasae TaxID=2715437 RepID=A0ABW2NX44_9BACL